MQYAKLENGYLIPAPGEVRQGGMVHDRDVNAAVNILALGVDNALRSVSVGSGGRVPRRRHVDPNNSSMDKTS